MEYLYTYSSQGSPVVSDDEFEEDLTFFTIPETPADRTPIAPAGMLFVMLFFFLKLNCFDIGIVADKHLAEQTLMNDMLDKEAELKNAEEEVKEEVKQFLEKEGGQEQGIIYICI